MAGCQHGDKDEIDDHLDKLIDLDLKETHAQLVSRCEERKIQAKLKRMPRASARATAETIKHLETSNAELDPDEVHDDAALNEFNKSDCEDEAGGGASSAAASATEPAVVHAVTSADDLRYKNWLVQATFGLDILHERTESIDKTPVGNNDMVSLISTAHTSVSGDTTTTVSFVQWTFLRQKGRRLTWDANNLFNFPTAASFPEQDFGKYEVVHPAVGVKVFKKRTDRIPVAPKFLRLKVCGGDDVPNYLL